MYSDLQSLRIDVLVIPSQIHGKIHTPDTHPPTRAHPPRAPPACGLTLLPRRPAASGHSQEVLHRDADDRPFHKRSGRRQRQRRRRTPTTLARDLRRGISRVSSLGGQGAWGRGLPARSRHPAFPSYPQQLLLLPTC